MHSQISKNNILPKPQCLNRQDDKELARPNIEKIRVNDYTSNH